MSKENALWLERAAKIEEQRKQIEALTAQVGVLREALKTLIDEHEECSDADDWMAMMCSCEAIHVAEEALAIPTDSTQILAEVRRAERERVEKMLLGELFDSTLRRNLISKIRAME